MPRFTLCSVFGALTFVEGYGCVNTGRGIQGGGEVQGGRWGEIEGRINNGMILLNSNFPRGQLYQHNQSKSDSYNSRIDPQNIVDLCRDSLVNQMDHQHTEISNPSRDLVIHSISRNIIIQSISTK